MFFIKLERKSHFLFAFLFLVDVASLDHHVKKRGKGEKWVSLFFVPMDFVD